MENTMGDIRFSKQMWRYCYNNLRMRYIPCLYLMLAPLFVSAQSKVLSIYKRQGEVVQYSFEEQPNIICHNGNLIVKSNNVEVSWPLGSVRKYTLNEGEKNFDSYDIVINDDNCLSYRNESDMEHRNITYIRTFSDTVWQALYVPFELKCSSCEDLEFALINNFHQYDDNNDGVFDRTVLEIRKANKKDILLPNYPYLVRAKDVGEKNIHISDAVLYATRSLSVDCSSIEIKYVFTGNYETLNDLRSRNLYTLNNGFLVKPTSVSQSLSPFRWYMTMNSRGSQTKEEPILINNTSIKVRVVDENIAQVDDVMFFSGQQNSLIYDIQGIKQNAVSRPGLYIMRTKDGVTHKVMIKK